MPDLALTSRVYRQLLSASFSADLPPELPDDQSLSAWGLRGLTISHQEWIRKRRIRAGVRARWQALFQEVDVMLCPPMPTVAFPHDQSPQFARQLDVDGKKVPYNDQSVWAGLATLNGFPATTVPIGHSPEGLPIGMQVVGGYLDDHTTLAFASLFEREFGGFTLRRGIFERQHSGVGHGCPVQWFCAANLPGSVACCPSPSRSAGPSLSPLAGRGLG
jgi:amidase